jgi:DNA-binding HxlR family transcriptional regulator
MHGATAIDAEQGRAPEATPAHDGCVCQVYQEAIELVGRRWTGAIITVLLGRPRRFCEISAAVPDLSDRLLAQRLKELEERGMIERIPCEERASSVRYALSPMGEDLAPALDAFGLWANRWLSDRPS